MKVRSRNSEGSVKTLLPEHQRDAAGLAYRPDWIAAARAAVLFERLHAGVDWQARTIRMFGRRLEQPRRIAFQGDPGVVYRYSNDDYHAEAWHPEVAALRDRLSQLLGVSFNSALLNLYRHGSDSMGWHADDEPELGDRPVIASVSLGAMRRFVLRSRAEPARKIELELAPGSLLVMSGDLQRTWQHQVPKTARPVGPRINLTFRRVQPPAR
ncbi:alpha-ketoglutarate-dependent dioxygenase AlkB [Wenzhouxiangella sp. XN79A]|uniref:alpha-ketoglutarate-dependent dioxygenase AlkB family protein n=1 Tax=Wenzhouxiangella sp. XN79A TaxID=2724193 RepID=UPI00144A6879|nr:alpha-ketoglutarate-dependent dioxygenase AlkB [Wenzhouxiangella sp. XN79A]NKI36009.1 alpha-ketoglutarate-dependent dioxygenase AlkB [Wenzhouxiangella sp. XN79A]